MRYKKAYCLICSAFAASVVIVTPATIRAQGVFHRSRTVIDSPHQDVTVKELAAFIDELDKELFEEGIIGIKAPDVWGQNRMTKYRAEYEKEMADQVNKFAVTLNAAIRRADTAVLTSATSIGMAVQPRPAAQGSGGTASNATAAPSTTINVPPAPGGTAQPLLDSISALLDKNATNLPQLPTTILPTDAIALEPKIGLDERDDYLKHLQELRRTNAGDDLTDAPGYGLYLVRMPVSLLPGPEVRKGHGAMVTVEAKHALTPDLLPNTFRDVAIMDAAYQINPVLLKLVHGVPLDIRNDSPATTAKAMQRLQKAQSPIPRAAAPLAQQPGAAVGVASTVPFSESPEIYGMDELNVLLASVREDIADTYRHDPSILSWVINELGSAHRFMREQARNGILADMFSFNRFQQLDLLLQQRNYVKLADWRKRFIGELVIRRNGFAPGGLNDDDFIKQHKRATDVFVYALMVQSVLVDRQLKHDMDVVSQQKGCACADLDSLNFYELFPTPEAREAFNVYVACKWPIHVFAIDPAVEQQNQLDIFSARSEFQAALAVGIASGNINFDQATKFARRLETDIETIGLNRTAIGYGAGESTFGWQFYPRIQSPPTPGNIRRLAGLIGGTSYNPNYVAKSRFIEPGPRECVALIVTPNFVPAIHFTSFGNWFEYAGAHADKKFDTGDVLEFSRKLQKAKVALNHVCDSGDYRPGEIARLSDRVAQLEAKLPSQDYRVPLPYEGDLTGSEVFSSSGTRLFPRLLSWFGEPAQVGKASTIFLLGTSYSVHETQVVAGGIPAADMKLISRNVMEVTIGEDARPIQTNDGRLIFDIHIATPNGISNHLFVEADAAPAAAPPAPAFGYALKTDGLAITYGVSGRVENDPTHPGVAQVLASDPQKIVLSWLEPVGLAPQVVNVTFAFSNLLPVTITGLTPDGNGQIVIGGPNLDKLSQEVLGRLQATAVTFDPVRNPTPLKPVATSSIVVTPTTGTHAEQDVTAAGTLTISFAPLALPANGLAPSGASQLPASQDAGSNILSPIEPVRAAPNEMVPQPSLENRPQAIPAPTPPAPNPKPGTSSTSERSLITPTRRSIDPGKVIAPARAMATPAQVSAKYSRGVKPVSPNVSAPIMAATPSNARSAVAVRSATSKSDPAVGRSSMASQTRPTDRRAGNKP